MQVTSVGLVNSNRELFQTVVLDIIWESMHMMTNRIRGIDDSHMS